VFHAEQVHDVADLLHELALVIPILPGARCKGQSRLYDRTIGRGLYDSPKITELARTQALQTCACCPALSACRQWFDGLPGVRAGSVCGTLLR
jgi:WhiB family transcriptional regulator, redox-sensing transcriptional regulator